MARSTRAKLVIIGSGPAGYTAAIYAARAMLEPILIAGIQPGGQMTITTDVENYPGFADVIQGPWLMEQMQKQAEHVGTRIINDHVKGVTLAARPFRLECDSGDRYLADSVIVATGAQARWLELPSEQKFVAMSPADEVVTTGPCGTVAWDWRTGTAVWAQPFQVDHITWDTDGSIAASTGPGALWRVWRTDTGEELALSRYQLQS